MIFAYCMHLNLSDLALLQSELFGLLTQLKIWLPIIIPISKHVCPSVCGHNFVPIIFIDYKECTFEVSFSLLEVVNVKVSLFKVRVKLRVQRSYYVTWWHMKGFDSSSFFDTFYHCRFQPVRKTFNLELRELKLRDQTPYTAQSVISLLMGLKFFRVKVSLASGSSSVSLGVMFTLIPCRFHFDPRDGEITDLLLLKHTNLFTFSCFLEIAKGIVKETSSYFWKSTWYFKTVMKALY